MRLVLGFFWLCSSLFIFGVTRGEASELVSKRKMKSLFPSAVNEWKQKDSLRTYDRDDIFNYMNGAGEFYLAYDYTDLYVAEYQKGERHPITVEVYRLDSSQDAFGVFHHDLGEGDKPDIAQGAIYAQGFFKGWKNNVFVRIIALQETPETKEFILSAAHEIFARITSTGPEPNLIAKLPKRKMAPDSQRYFHKNVSLNNLYFLATTNILNLSEKTNAALAAYPLAKAKAKLILIEYPTRAAAKKAYRSFTEAYFPEIPTPSGTEVIRKIENDQLAGVKLISRYLYLIFEVTEDNFIKEVFQTTENDGS